MDNPEGDVAPEQTIDAGGEAPAPAEQAAPESNAPLSMADALAQAKVSTATAPTPESATGDTPAPDGDGPAPAPDATKPPEGRKSQKNEDHGTLRRINELRRQDRLGELDPRAAGELRRLEEDISNRAVETYKVTTAEEAEFRSTYIELLAMAEEDPAKYRDLIRAQPDWIRFEQSYRASHPEVTLANPDPVKAADPVKVRTEIANAYGKGFEQTLDAIAADAGLSDEAYSKLKAEYNFGSHPDSANLSVFLGKMFTDTATAMAEAIVAKRLPELQKSERTAAETAASRKLGLTARPPKFLPDRSTGPNPPSDTSGPISMGEAARQARELIATR